MGRWPSLVPRTLLILFLLATRPAAIQAAYTGSVAVVPVNSSIQSAGTEIMGSGGGTGNFIYKGGGNAVDAAVATALAACIIVPSSCSLGGYGGHMMIWKSGWDGDPQKATCIDFNTAAGSLASSNMFVGSVNLTNGHWTGTLPAANLVGWKTTGVPGTFAGLYMAQTNYGRKINGTNFFPFAEIMKTALARVANGQAIATPYYTLTSVSNLLMDLYTNADPNAVFYTGDIAQAIAATMQTNGGLVTYADMTNYRPREVTPYARHFSCPGGTPATVYMAPLGSSGLSVMQELAMIEALGWTNGPTGTWDNLHYWHSRAEVARLSVKDHYQWMGDPSAGVTPPDFLGNGSTNFFDQMLAHATISYSAACPWDANEIRLTNSYANLITDAVNQQTNLTISVDWDDIRYGTCNISTSDQWGNCVAVTLSMGASYGAHVAVTNRAIVFGQSMALFDARPGWPNSIAPGKRPVDNMSPAIVVPDLPISPTNGSAGGRPPFAVGAAGGSTIENNMAMQLAKYLMDGPSSSTVDPAYWLYNFEANTDIYMLPSFPAGVASYLNSVGFATSTSPPETGLVSHVEAWIAPAILTPPTGSNITSGSSISLAVTATGLPLFYQWSTNGVPLSDGGSITGSQTSQLNISAIAQGAAYTVTVSNGAGIVTSSAANLTVDGKPAIVTQPASLTNAIGSTTTFSVSAIGNNLAYQWMKNGSPLAATNSALILTNVYDQASYSVVITNVQGSVTSAIATLTIVLPNTLLLYEPFDYTNVGSSVSANTPTNWTFGGSGADDLNVASGNLSYPGLAASIGNSVTNGGAGLGVRRLLGTNISGGKIYFSALLRINDLGFGSWNGQTSSLASLTAPDNTSFRLQVIVKSNSPNGYLIGTQKSGTGATSTLDTTERHAGDTLFLVGKYDFTVTPNVAKLWVNPAVFGSVTEPSNGAITATNGLDGFTIDRFNLRQNAATGSFSVPTSVQWDELRFGLAWSDVTPPALVTLTGSARAGPGSFQFSYTNLSGLTYTVFAATNLIDWNAIGQATQISSGIFQFTDSATANFPYRFYQLRSP